MLNLSKLNMHIMERHERITEALDNCGKKRESVATAIGVSAATLSQWSSGETKNLRLDNLFKLEDETGYSARWIAIEDGPKYRINEVTSVQERKPAYRESMPISTRIYETLAKLEHKNKISAQLVNAIEAIIAAAAPATGNNLSTSTTNYGLMNYREPDDLGLSDEEHLVEITDHHLQKALEAIQNFRARKQPPPVPPVAKSQK